ncbi:MAG TPA: hypothetical protein VGM89_12660 [Puia sp.]|jgi:hypothetical protein
MRTPTLHGLFTWVLLLLLAAPGQAQPPAIRTVRLIGDNPDSQVTPRPLVLGKQFYVEFVDSATVYGSLKDVILYVNDTPLPQCSALSVNGEKKRIYFKFTLDRGANGNSKTIVDFIRKDLGSYDNRVSLSLGVGLANGTKVSSGVPVVFDFFNPWIVIGISIVAAFLIVWTLATFYKKGGFDDPPVAGATPTKSLSKFQFALWVLVIAFVYLSLWLVLHEVPVLPPSVLGILLITVGAAGTSSLIPTNKPTTASTGLRTMLINENGSPSIGRLQYLLFTGIFLALFISTAFLELRVYDFQPQQLALMGVSTAGYLGLKTVKGS